MAELQKQVKSKRRVTEYGEVFTAEREVKAMCDLVKAETKRIDSRFLEPACGEGAFLTEILRRKLEEVKSRYVESPSDYKTNAMIAISSIYGVDILADNVEACRKKLYEIWDTAYTESVAERASDQCREAVKYILRENIICGNTLAMLKADGTPIVFSEWSMLTGCRMRRRSYTMQELINENEAQTDIYQMGLERGDETVLF